jgi:hypothetical protein
LLKGLKKWNATLVVQDTLWYQHEAIVLWLQSIKGELKDSFGNIHVYQLDQLAIDRRLNALNKNLEN